MSMVSIRVAEFPTDAAIVRRLLGAYTAEIGMDPTMIGVTEELACLPGPYSGPKGFVLLAEAEGNVVGCVAIRPMEDGEAELKRLYVAPEVRGRQVGRALVMEALHTARSAGIQKLFLDTLATMDRAIAVYQRVGFRPCPAPRKVPYEAQFFAMDFGAVPAKASSNE